MTLPIVALSQTLTVAIAVERKNILGPVLNKLRAAALAESNMEVEDQPTTKKRARADPTTKTAKRRTLPPPPNSSQTSTENNASPRRARPATGRNESGKRRLTLIETLDKGTTASSHTRPPQPHAPRSYRIAKPRQGRKVAGASSSAVMLGDDSVIDISPDEEDYDEDGRYY